MFIQKRAENGVVFYYSDLLPCPHAFGTRLGGVSSADHLKSLNVGANRGDAPENVKRNLDLLCDAADVSRQVVSARQIHSAIVMYVDALSSEKPSLDGFYTDKEGLALCVKSADCLPILLCDLKSGAVAALHAGWRGSVRGVADEGVRALCSLGTEAKNIVAAIGAGIGKCCFEVKDDFIEEFSALAGEDAARRYITARQIGMETRFYADLKVFNADRLVNAGLLREHIDISPSCTCCAPNLFFSHRYTKGVRGTMGAVIAVGQRK